MALYLNISVVSLIVATFSKVLLFIDGRVPWEIYLLRYVDDALVCI